MNVSSTDRLDARDDDSTGGSTHSQAFLQQRVALFALSGFLLSLTFLVFRVGSSLAAGRLSLIHPSMVTHVVGMATYLTVWLVARRGRYSTRTIRGLENAAILLTAIFYTVMATILPIGFRPDFVMILCLNLVVMTRSILVPSTTRRTTIVVAVVGAILVAGAYRAFDGADLSRESPSPRLISTQLFQAAADTSARERCHSFLGRLPYRPTSPGSGLTGCSDDQGAAGGSYWAAGGTLTCVAGWVWAKISATSVAMRGIAATTSKTKRKPESSWLWWWNPE